MNHFCQCWGRESGGRLGIPDGFQAVGDSLGDEPGEMGSNMQPLIFSDGFIPVQLSLGFATSCAVSMDHKCCCWGNGVDGATGQGNTDNLYTPTTVSLGSGFDVELLSVGYHSACAVSTIGEMKVCDFENVQS